MGEPYVDRVKELLDVGHSILHLSNNSVSLFGEKISYDILSTTCRHHNIKIPTLKDTANSKITRSLYKATVESVYGKGITNVSQSTGIKEKKNNTNLARYGVENPFQRPEIKEKSKDTLYKKYGVFNPCELPNYTRNNGRFSKPHKKVSEFLSSQNILHENDKAGMFRKYNEDMKRVYSPIPDIFIPDKRIVIEIFGDRWHMNPTIYFETDIVDFFDGPHTAKEVWHGDQIRNNHIMTFGVDILVIWEYDIKHNFEQVKQVIKERLK
jgi:very-short-patch-repair endonuclease